MDIISHPNWAICKKRFQAWWNHDLLDRCCIQVYAPKTGSGTYSGSARDPARPWADFAEIVHFNHYILNHMFYGGEAFPVWRTHAYPFTNTMAAFMGCPVEIRDQTGWVYPIIAEGDLRQYDYHDFDIDKDSDWYVLDEKLHLFLAEQLKQSMVRSVWIGASSGDTLAAMRGTEQLLMDIVDCPEYVGEFDRYLVKKSLDLYITRYNQVFENADQGITDWFSLWAPSKYHTIQNDFAYMISTGSFNEVFLPTIEMQTEFFDYTFYHCDGVGNFKHIDALCSLPKLAGIQVLPGAGKPSPLHYMQDLQKVQASKKNLHISLPPEEVETALATLSHRGLMIATHCETEAEANDLLALVERFA